MKILIADDNDDIVYTLGVMLEIIGHTALIAKNGIQAFEMILACSPQIAILDIGMPGMNGLQVAKAIRTLPLSSSIKLPSASLINKKPPCSSSNERGNQKGMVSFTNWLK